MIRDDNELLIVALNCKERESNSDSKKSKQVKVVQAINFAIEIGVRDIILEWDLAYVIDKL